LYFPPEVSDWSNNGTVGTVQGYAYNDTTGWLQSTIDVAGGTFAFGYTPRGDLNTVTGPSVIGYVETRTVDGDGNMTADSIGGFQLLREAHFQYDGRGKQTFSGNKVNLFDTVSVAYSGLGSVVSYTAKDSVNGTAGHTAEHFTNDAFGNVASDTTSNTTYLQFGNQISLTDGASQKTWTYNSTTGVLLQDVNTSSQVFTETYAYDTAGNTHFYSQGFDSTKAAPNQIQDRASFYNAEDRLVEADYRTILGPQSGAFGTGFLKRADETFRYDALGRRVLVVAMRFCGPTGATEFGDVNDCRRTWVRRTIWDGQQELVEIQQPDSILNFNPNQMVASVTELDSGITQLTPDQYAQDNNHYFGQVMYTHGLAVDQPLGLIRLNYSDATGDTLYYQFPPLDLTPFWNAQGRNDVIGLGQVSGGSLIAGVCSMYQGKSRCPVLTIQPGFAAYNNISVNPRGSWIGTIVEDKLDATWTQYRRAREYDPITGRFTQPDPIGLAGGINDYGFASGDPVNYSDPFGLCAEGDNDGGGDSTKRAKPVECTYTQHTGELSCREAGNRTQGGNDAGGAVEDVRGYSGAPGHVNKPEDQNLKNQGPIPQGGYRIEVAFPGKHNGMDDVMRVTPMPGTNTFGRSAFEIHGDSRTKPGTASAGCIAIGKDARAKINGGGTLTVVP